MRGESQAKKQSMHYTRRHASDLLNLTAGCRRTENVGACQKSSEGECDLPGWMGLFDFSVPASHEINRASFRLSPRALKLT